MSNVFKKGNYIKEMNNDHIYKVVEENVCQTVFEKYFMTPSKLTEDEVIIKRIYDNVYFYTMKSSSEFILVDYMNSPLWKVLNNENI